MRFLVDVNMPKHFSFFNSDAFVHVCDINERLSDRKIWEFALTTDLVILTKDTDFYNLAITESKKARVVHFQLGNTTLKELHTYFEQHWLVILNAISENYLVVAEPYAIDIVV